MGTLQLLMRAGPCRLALGWMVWSLACLAVAGCGAEKGGPVRAGVKGVVTYRGKPVSKAQIVFTPEQPGPIAEGFTDDRGSFALQTQGSKGAVTGWHKVTVILRGPPVPPANPPPEGGLPGQFDLPGPPLVPERYLQPETTPLRFEVLPDRTNEFTLTLTD